MQTSLTTKPLTALHNAKAALTSPLATRIYRTTGRSLLVTTLLLIAAILWLARCTKSAHAWAQNHKDWQYEDFEQATRAFVAGVVGSIHERILGVEASTEMAIRAQISRIGDRIILLAAPTCDASNPAPHCKLRRGVAQEG